MMALQVGIYHKVYGDHKLEKLEKYASVTELDDAAKKIFALGM